MTRDDETVLMFKGLISTLPAEKKAGFDECERTLRSMLAKYPDGEAFLAIGLIGAEVSASV
jgi:hypothetical protein